MMMMVMATMVMVVLLLLLLLLLSMEWQWLLLEKWHVLVQLVDDGGRRGGVVRVHRGVWPEGRPGIMLH